MPKEIINGDSLVSDGSFVHVGWSKENDLVHLATVNPNGGLTLVEKPESIAGPTGEVIYTHLDVSTPGWFIDLDRAGINRLIRSLRKARDDTFGRDE